MPSDPTPSAQFYTQGFKEGFTIQIDRMKIGRAHQICKRHGNKGVDTRKRDGWQVWRPPEMSSAIDAQMTELVF